MIDPFRRVDSLLRWAQEVGFILWKMTVPPMYQNKWGKLTWPSQGKEQKAGWFLQHPSLVYPTDTKPLSFFAVPEFEFNSSRRGKLTSRRVFWAAILDVSGQFKGVTRKGTVSGCHHSSCCKFPFYKKPAALSFKSGRGKPSLQCWLPAGQLSRHCSRR